MGGQQTSAVQNAGLVCSVWHTPATALRASGRVLTPLHPAPPLPFTHSAGWGGTVGIIVASAMLLFSDIALVALLRWRCRGGDRRHSGQRGWPWPVRIAGAAGASCEPRGLAGPLMGPSPRHASPHLPPPLPVAVASQPLPALAHPCAPGAVPLLVGVRHDCLCGLAGEWATRQAWAAGPTRPMRSHCADRSAHRFDAVGHGLLPLPQRRRHVAHVSGAGRGCCSHEGAAGAACCPARTIHRTPTSHCHPRRYMNQW